MQRTLDELQVGTWYAGLRRRQSRSRASIEPVQSIGRGRYKVHPIFDWTDRDVYDYLKRHDLPYHPLWERGYVSIGDWHTTRSLHEVGDRHGRHAVLRPAARMRPAPDRNWRAIDAMRHLPVFLDLQAAPALVVGGGRVAATQARPAPVRRCCGHRRRSGSRTPGRRSGRSRRASLAPPRVRSRRCRRHACRLRSDRRHFHQ